MRPYAALVGFLPDARNGKPQADDIKARVKIPRPELRRVACRARKDAIAAARTRCALRHPRHSLAFSERKVGSVAGFLSNELK
jgi:hypothetical protein